MEARKPLSQVIGEGKKDPEEPMPAPAESADAESELDVGELDAADGIISAVESGSREALGAALKDFVRICVSKYA
jgi:hypothetical protein